MNEFFLEAQDIVKCYANHKALDGVSIKVPQGKVFGLLGPNGAGKTTLIRIINRITAPDSGKVYFNGHLSQPDDIYNIGYLPEERGLYKKMKVGEQAIYLAQLKGLDKREATKRLKEWFDKFEITQWWDKKLEELSKGMQQKVQFVITVTSTADIRRTFLRFRPCKRRTSQERNLRAEESGTHHHFFHSQYVIGRGNMRQHSLDKPLACGTAGRGERSPFAVQDQHLQVRTPHGGRTVRQQYIRDSVIRRKRRGTYIHHQKEQRHQQFAVAVINSSSKRSNIVLRMPAFDERNLHQDSNEK